MQHPGLIRPHWIQTQAFQFYVLKLSGLQKEITPIQALNIEAGFMLIQDAFTFARCTADGLNFVLIFDGGGKVVKAFSPDQHKAQD